MRDKITMEEYCKNICRTHVKVNDFKDWLRLYDFQPLKLQLEKKLEISKQETEIVKIELLELKQDLEITKFAAACKSSDLAKYTRELAESKTLNKKMKSEYNKVNVDLKRELDQAKFEINQIKSELNEALEDINSSQKIFQKPKDCAKTFVDNKKGRLLIENTIEEFKHYFNLTSYKSAFLELGIQIKVSDEGSVRLNRLMKSFCYKTAYEAIKYFKQNKVNAIAIKQKPTVEDKSSFVAFSIDPSQNSVGLIIPTEIK